MTRTYFEEMMAELGCHSAGDVAMGVAPAPGGAAEGGLPYSAELLATGEPVRIVFRFALCGPVRRARALLKAKKPSHLRFFVERDAENADGVLAVVLSAPSDFYVKSAIHSLFLGVQAAVTEAGLRPPEECPLCNLSRCDRYAYLGDAYRATHAACLESRLALPEQDSAPPKRAPGNLFTGILGAVLGALLGAVPIWAMMLSRGVSYAALYAFIPLLSALVYRLARGKARLNVAAIVVLLASLLAAFALEQVWFWLELTVTLGNPDIAIADSMRVYFSGASLGGILGGMWGSLLFLMIGYIASGIFLRRYAATAAPENHITRGARFVRQTAAPIRPAMAEDAGEGAEKQPPDGTTLKEAKEISHGPD